MIFRLQIFQNYFSYMSHYMADDQMDLKNFVFLISTLLDLVKVLFDTFVQWSGILYQQKLGMLILCHLLRKKFENGSHQIVNVYFVQTFWVELVLLVVTTAQLHSTKPELRFCTCSSPALSVLEIHDGEDLWQWSQLEIWLNAFRLSTKPQKTIQFRE